MIFYLEEKMIFDPKIWPEYFAIGSKVFFPYIETK